MVMNINQIVIHMIFIWIIMLLCLTLNVEGEGCDVYFLAPPDNETNFVFVGEEDISLRLLFFEDCSNYSVELDHPLFIGRLSGRTPMNFKNGSCIDKGLNINETADPGTYIIDMTVSYVNADDNTIFKDFQLTLDYIEALRITDLHIPDNTRREFSIDIETMVHLSDLSIIIETLGFEVEIGEHHFQSCDVGHYHVDTGITRMRSSFDKRILTYKVIAINNSRHMFFSEHGIEIDLHSDSNSENDEEDQGLVTNLTIVIICSLIIVVVLSYFILYRARKKMPEQQDERSIDRPSIDGDINDK